GRMETLERYRAQTPEGVQEMLAIKGFGPKKVRVVWKDLGVETIGELLYAVNENRLLELKGFGPKTQEELKHQLEYYQRSKDKFHWAALEAEAVAVRDHLRERLPGVQVEWAGAWRRGCNVVERIEVLVGAEGPLPEIPEGLVNSPLTIYQCAPEAFGSRWFRHTGSAEFLEAFVRAFPGKDFRDLATEEAVFQRA
ncbi:MAG: DNA polymerase/3'-5' exonuclease PolX, partial [Saprospiraceae bacterium]|nr:DNA polymerase/3'-5' exonuclease PolX [Saprospiraceae bacterium]